MKPTKLTSKFQTTVPKEVRNKLGLEAGDYIVFNEVDGVITISKVEPIDWKYLQAIAPTLEEWSSAADEEAYADL